MLENQKEIRCNTLYSEEDTDVKDCTKCDVIILNNTLPTACRMCKSKGKVTREYRDG
jgi:hypothetical protein